MHHYSEKESARQAKTNSLYWFFPHQKHHALQQHFSRLLVLFFFIMILICADMIKIILSAYFS